MSHWTQAFLEAQVAELDAATNTQLAYARDLTSFSSWLAARRMHFSTVSQQGIEGYLIDCEAEGLAKSTRARRLSAIRQLFRFAFEEDWRQDNPALRMKGPGKDRKLPGTLDLVEVERLITAARENGDGRDRLRNTCLMELLYATGMRVTELVSLPVAAARGDPRMLWYEAKVAKSVWYHYQHRQSQLWRLGWCSGTRKNRPYARRRV